jgi:hypothetical protein
VTRLSTPALQRIVPENVFDAFGWCESDVLEWRRPWDRWDDTTPIDGGDPARMVFVMYGGAGAFLPRELARIHATGWGMGEEEALAPWAIDDATDELYARLARPREVMWLAADNLNALFWGLHDWAHFHNHGPFEQRAWTELQCDVTALVWLWVNRGRIPVDDSVLERVRGELLALSSARFRAERHEGPGEALSTERVQELVRAATRTSRS